MMLRSLLLTLFASCFVSGAQAENLTRIDNYWIHHNAFTTDLLAPEVARNYGISRSNQRGMLNLSIIRGGDSILTGTPVAATVQVQATDFLGQTREIPLREIREDQAIYYVGDFRVAHEEWLKFTMQILPAGADQPLKLKMEHQFFHH